MTITLDASVVAKLYFEEEYTDSAQDLIAEAGGSGETMLAPYLLASECINITRRKVRLESLSLARARTAIDEFLTLPIQYRADADIYRQAILLSERYGLSGFDVQ